MAQSYFTKFFRPRPSGSDSDTGSDEVGTRHQPSVVGHPGHATVGNSGPMVRVRAHPMAAQINSTPSPQLSLPEFLQETGK